MCRSPFLPCRLWARNSFSAKAFCFGILLSLVLSSQSLQQMPAVSQNTGSNTVFAASLTLMLLSSLQETVSSLPHKIIFLSFKPFSRQRNGEFSPEDSSCCSSKGDGEEGRSTDRERESLRCGICWVFPEKNILATLFVEMRCTKRVGMATSY